MPGNSVAVRGSAVCAAALAMTNPAAASAFDIALTFSGSPTTSQEAAFTDAEAFWESQVTGYQPGVADRTLVIDASIKGIDGDGETLGQAGPTYGVDDEGFTLPTKGTMEFDSADVGSLESTGTFGDVVRHEMAHVMGFGTLWTDNSVYTNGTGQYIGNAGLAAYKAEFHPSAAFVPVELDHGPGTKDAHWDEGWAGGNTALMTGFLNTPTFVSRTTVESFADLGYTVAPVPLPAGAWLMLGALGTLGLVGRRLAA